MTGRQIYRNCPQRRTHSLNGGSASRIHQHTAPQKGDRIQNSSTYSPIKGGPPLEVINQSNPPLDFITYIGVRLQNSSTYSPQKGGLPLEFINIHPQNGGPLLELIIINLKMRGPPPGGQFLWIYLDVTLSHPSNRWR